MITIRLNFMVRIIGVVIIIIVILIVMIMKNTKNKYTATTTNNNNINNNDNNNPRTSKQQKINIIWSNPPFSKNIATKIGRYFLNLIGKHFP